MKYSQEEIENLRAKVESPVIRTAQLQQVLAQIEASLSRTEHQKVKEKSRKT